MESLAADGQLAAWVHRGFWQPMDTLRDKQNLNSLWTAEPLPGSYGKDERDGKGERVGKAGDEGAGCDVEAGAMAGS